MERITLVIFIDSKLAAKCDTGIIKGCQIYHDFLRPHDGFEWKTSAESCGIEVTGENKRLTVIQNATGPAIASTPSHPTAS